MTTPPTIQTNPLDPVFSGVPVVYPQMGMVNPTWNKWFVDLREKVNVINNTLASWSGISPVTGLTSGTYGDTTHYPIVTVNQYGMITAISVQTVSGGGGNPIYITNVSSNITVALSNVPNTSANKGLIVVNSGSATIVSIDTFANTGIPIGTELTVFQQSTGSTSLVGLTGVTFQGPTISGGGQGASGRVIQIAQDIWMVSGNIAYASGGDPYWTSVLSLCHFDGSNGSTTITDQKSNTWTVNGNAALSTSQFKFGTASLLSSTGGAISSVLAAFTTGDFTIEFFLYMNVSSPSGVIIIDFRTASLPNNPVLYFSSSNIIYYVGANAIIGTSLTISTWYHIALCRASGISKLFIAGTQVGSSYTDVNNFSAAPATLLEQYNSAGSTNAYMDELRITAAARYTSNFTPPTAPFPDN